MFCLYYQVDFHEDELEHDVWIWKGECLDYTVWITSENSVITYTLYLNLVWISRNLAKWLSDDWELTVGSTSMCVIDQVYNIASFCRCRFWMWVMGRWCFGTGGMSFLLFHLYNSWEKCGAYDICPWLLLAWHWVPHWPWGAYHLLGWVHGLMVVTSFNFPELFMVTCFCWWFQVRRWVKAISVCGVMREARVSIPLGLFSSTWLTRVTVRCCLREMSFWSMWTSMITGNFIATHTLVVHIEHSLSFVQLGSYVQIHICNHEFWLFELIHVLSLRQWIYVLFSCENGNLCDCYEPPLMPLMSIQGRDNLIIGEGILSKDPFVCISMTSNGAGP